MKFKFQIKVLPGCIFIVINAGASRAPTSLLYLCKISKKFRCPLEKVLNPTMLTTDFQDTT